MNLILLGMGVVLGVVIVFVLWRLLPAWRHTRGTRVVTCPETDVDEAVEMDTRTALQTAWKGDERLRLSNCTRWPEREGCAQECLTQIEDSPSGCVVSELLNDWYVGKSCVLCATEFGELNWHTHKPGLMNLDRKMLRWSDVPAKELHDVLEKYFPVCWDCLVVESFIEANPDKVTHRPGDVVRGGGANPSDQ